MGPIVVLVLAIAVVLVAAVAVGVWRLVGAVRTLTAGLGQVQQRLQPIVDELQEGTRTTGVELEALQASIDGLRERRDGQV